MQTTDHNLEGTMGSEGERLTGYVCMGGRRRWIRRWGWGLGVHKSEGPCRA